MSKKKIVIIIIALCVVAGLCVWYFGGFGAGIDATDPTGDSAPVTYTVELKSEGGMAMADVGVYVYTDSTQQELVWFAKTDENGIMTFTDVASDSYIAVLADLPEGFSGEESYPLTGELTQIVVKGGLAVVEDLATVQYNLGDLMGDFTVTDADGNEYTVSELLKSKKAVVLNFWYIQCVPCQQEFPFLQEAYELYGEDIEILAMNPVNQEPAAIEEFKEEMGLTFPMISCDPSWETAMQLTAYPTTVVIDRYGTVALIHKGSIPDTQTFANIFAFFTAEDYQQTVVENVEELPEAEVEEEGTIDNPTEVGGVSSFEVTVKAGEVVYVDLYKANNLYLSINSKNAYIICDNVTYKPGGNSVGLIVKAPDTFTPVKLGFGNQGEETETFTVSLSQFAGTLNNPYTMELGDFATSINAGNDQGVYYSYTAAADGVLTVKCLKSTAGVEYQYTLYNQTSMAFRTLSTDGVIDENGYPSLSVQVKKGHQIQFSVGTLPDSSKNYPAGDYTFRASFDEGAEIEGGEQVELTDYAITVTDGDRTPMPGVFFNVTVDGGVKNIGTNENGVASIKLEPGTYDVALVTPKGYKANTTSFKLTEAFPTFSVKLDPDVIITKTYTVKVVDEEAKPVANVLVSLESSFGYTDANGCISFTMEQGDYTAMIVVPEGYTAETMTYPFPEGQTELTITLKADGGGEKPVEPSKPGYSVTVVDYFGKPMSGVVAQFLKDGEMVTGVPVNASGVAAAQLDPGEYTVKLVFSGQTYYYDQTATTLTAENPAITITVVPGVSGGYEELYVGDAYLVNVGGTYVEMQSNVVNYFIFEPTVSGLYQFTTSDPAAKISYWGGSTAFISDLTASTDYQNNTFTRNVKESNLGVIYIIGVTGASDCILKIDRIGDAILDETDIPATVYTATTKPTAYKLNMPAGKKLINVDLTAATGTYNLVFNEADGYYHLNSASGPIMYVNLGPNAPYVSMYNLLGFTGFGGTSLNKTFRDASGNVTKREDYTDCMMQYVECIDGTYGVYPLTKDLVYMLQHSGDHKGWWDSTNGNYLFADVKGLNTEIAWMFACCYIG